jgi:hypothetical protein
MWGAERDVVRSFEEVISMLIVERKSDIFNLVSVWVCGG